jgi:hypothetical protein
MPGRATPAVTAPVLGPCSTQRDRSDASLPVSSTESMIGHALGAADAIESSFCPLAMGDGMPPPTSNYRRPRPRARSRLHPERRSPGKRRCRALERHGSRRPLPVSRGRAQMSDRRPYSLLPIRELGHGIHDLPRVDTSYLRSFAVRPDPHENRLPIDRSAESCSSSSRGASPSSGARRPAWRPSSARVTLP